MKIACSLLVLAFFYSSSAMHAQPSWQMASVPLQTRWAKEVSPTNVLPEYPRPQMVRARWTNLNGLWDYAITDKDAVQPTIWDGQILVPYPLESALSGVKKALLSTQNLWYKTVFSNPINTINPTNPGSDKRQRILLHFGAVDWQATVFVNGREAGFHTGGYTEFRIDVTDELKPGRNELLVKVYDPSDRGIGPHGKQVLEPGNIYYTPTSGIWQTVWLEVVPKDYIQSLTLTPNIDSGFVSVIVHSSRKEAVQLTANGSAFKGQTNCLIRFPLDNARLWSPDDPYLYDLTVKTKTDEVKSYFGMRKIEVKKDEKGVDRIFLNNHYTYNLGMLDQGFWPEGLYTAPTDEALAFDVKALKAMGFNTIRKHIKVEPARWYYDCDKIGMLVWQDMVNPNQGLPDGAKEAFEVQMKETLVQLHNYSCITTWVLFNEGWGQYDQKRLTDWLKAADPSRIVNGHTGELLYVNEQLRNPAPDAYVDADLTDVHSYPSPMLPVKQSGKAQVVGEFGGIGLAVPGHEWTPTTGWGYIETSAAQLPGKYQIMVEDLKLLEQLGLSGSIYTQPYDVEGEENGLMTYDREYVKIPIARLREINSELVPTAPNMPQDVVIKDNDKTDQGERYAEMLKRFIYNTSNEQSDTVFLQSLAINAQKQNDRTGAQAANLGYVRALKPPYSLAQANFIKDFTTSSKDSGFAIIRENENEFGELLGKDSIRQFEMRLVYKTEIEPFISTVKTIDWKALRTRIMPYGPAGEEMYLRIRTIHDLSNQDLTDFKLAAKEYLDKYGANLSESERKMFQSRLESAK
jgi:Glycosyl hydrolases family 2, sugar binding domain/Glycosyl hydrolases family 2/Glycosyl hydrolases family 2, TIM barrel domain